MSTCKKCGAPIIWIITPAGKAMPCDPRLTPYWAKDKAPGKVVTPNGEVVSCVFEGERDKASGMGYIAHFATCPAAESFKRR